MASKVDEKSKSLSEVDIRTADKSSLTDINEIVINTNQPVGKRVESYIKQVSNPYCVLVEGVAVKFTYSDTKDTLGDRLKDFFTHEPTK